MSSASTPCSRPEKKHWWLRNRKVVERYAREARALLLTQQPSNAVAAITLLDSALAVSPRNEAVLELKARCLLFLRRFREVADLLQDYIPSFRSTTGEDEDSTNTATSMSTTTSSSSSSSSKHRSSSASSEEYVPLCFSVSDLKRRLWSHSDREGQWRYLVLGQACYHLGMMEDALVLLQTWRRLAAACCRRESLDLHDDRFSSGVTCGDPPKHQPPQASTSPESSDAAALLGHVKQLLRRRAAAVAALEADLPVESARHFSKILDARRGLPHVFAAGCLIGRAAAHRAAGRVAEAIADCNRALAVDPGSIRALRLRSDLLESICSLPDCVRDLDHLKLLYDAVIWDKKLPGPPWRPHHGVRYGDVAGSLRSLTARIHVLRRRIAGGEWKGIDYYLLFGLQKGCGRSELQRAHLLLSMKHRPEKSSAFVDRLELADVDAVRDQARTSAMYLYRLLQKGYSRIMATIAEEEAARVEEREREREREREKEKELAAAVAKVKEVEEKVAEEKVAEEKVAEEKVAEGKGEMVNVEIGRRVERKAATGFQGVFCRDLAAVSSLLSRVGSQAMPVKLEAMSC